MRKQRKIRESEGKGGLDGREIKRKGKEEVGKVKVWGKEAGG